MENFQPDLKKREDEGKVIRRYSHFHTIFWDNCSICSHGKITLGKGLVLDISFWGSVQYPLHSAGVDHHNVPAGEGEAMGNIREPFCICYAIFFQ